METKTSLSVSESTAEIVTLYKQFSKLQNEVSEWYERNFIGESKDEVVKHYNVKEANDFNCKVFAAAETFSDFLQEQINISVRENLTCERMCI